MRWPLVLTGAASPSAAGQDSRLFAARIWTGLNSFVLRYEIGQLTSPCRNHQSRDWPLRPIYFDFDLGVHRRQWQLVY